TTRASAWRWEPDERSPVARRVLRAGALRPDVVPADGAGAVRATDDELDGGDASLLRRLLPAGGGSDPVLRQVRARRHARRRPAVAPVAVLARHGLVPGRGLAPAPCPRQRRRLPRPPDRTDPVTDITVLRADRWVD